LSEGLFHPLHDSREPHPVLRPDIEREQVILNAEAPDLEGEAEGGFDEYFVEEGKGCGATEEGLPVVNPGTYFIPNVLGKFSCLSHVPYTGMGAYFALVGVTNGT
jgi:hypothetical protein